MSARKLAWLPRTVAVLGGLVFLLPGIWAMASPQTFFEQSAAFEPYNQHFLQDIGAFQIGLGAVLLLAALWAGRGALAVALGGVGIGAAAHLVSHLIGSDLGGRPATDIPFFAIITIVLLVGAYLASRQRSQ